MKRKMGRTGGRRLHSGSVRGLERDPGDMPDESLPSPATGLGATTTGLRMGSCP